MLENSAIFRTLMLLNTMSCGDPENLEEGVARLVDARVVSSIPDFIFLSTESHF